MKIHKCFSATDWINWDDAQLRKARQYFGRAWGRIETIFRGAWSAGLCLDMTETEALQYAYRVAKEELNSRASLAAHRAKK